MGRGEDMKKIFVLIGSRRKEGNTIKLAKNITKNLDMSNFEIEYAMPQDYTIRPCIGCNNCFINTRCSIKDDIELLQEKILNSDVFIIASPVYIHYMTADLKLILDRSAWWAHTLRLQGKPVVVLSTCSSNGFTTVLEPLSNIITFMGGNVIATSNAAEFPNQIHNEEWLDEVSQEIANRITKFAYLPPQSNSAIEKAFSSGKRLITEQEKFSKNSNIELGEYKYWRETGMLKYDTFKNYLEARNKEVKEQNEDSIPATI
ncbi:flavodoxin family protein [Clostridium botulinum]|uniref:flavodoxin family protein n=1 Tax=Clostridium botulinum TaxID=1491 RepID=UPI000D1194BC|nr:flavodoxin family protein [Clostridium botulinum]AVQ44940.1 NADPH-dependent oxidoreductase [Clostridium botulinum]AVQ49011.1 NADPH-dependent oxidoreductase [Clostridium botulinum]